MRYTTTGLAVALLMALTPSFDMLTAGSAISVAISGIVAGIFENL